MNYLDEIRAYLPPTEEEKAEREIVLEACLRDGDSILTRANSLYHMTSSGFVMDPELKNVLMVYHNIYRSWAWTGGHCDGDGDLLAVALREAQEETGAEDLRPLSRGMASLDILTVENHYKRGAYVPAHLHINASYILISEDTRHLRAKPDENSGVAWIPVEQLDERCSEPDILLIYKKLIERAKNMKESTNGKV